MKSAGENPLEFILNRLAPKIVCHPDAVTQNEPRPVLPAI